MVAINQLEGTISQSNLLTETANGLLGFEAKITKVIFVLIKCKKKSIKIQKCLQLLLLLESLIFKVIILLLEY